MSSAQCHNALPVHMLRGSEGTNQTTIYSMFNSQIFYNIDMHMMMLN